MIGVLDSGEGGMNAARYLEQKTEESIVFFPDRKNAPYGTKTRDELISLLSGGIDRLLALGASRVLIACCTAGTVYPYLDEKRKTLSFPLIRPTARAAVKSTRSGKIALIATEATVRSHAFSEEIKKAAGELNRDCRLLEIKAQPLVSMVERRATGIKISEGDEDLIRKILLPLKDFGADTLILGCTHFPSLEDRLAPIAKELGIISLISSVKEGTDAFLR